MRGKKDFEKWYSKEDPWHFDNTLDDLVRRSISLYHLRDVFDQTKVQSILDAGCGAGYFTKDLANCFSGQIDAFDISENAIRYANKKNFAENINYYQLDIRDFQATKLYDLITCEQVLYYLDDEERIPAIKIFYDALNDEAYLKISVVCIGNTPHRAYFTLEEISTILTENGFLIQSVIPSTVKKKYLLEKIFYKLFNNSQIWVKLPFLIRYFVKRTLSYPLNRCFSVSILSKKHDSD